MCVHTHTHMYNSNQTKRGYQLDSGEGIRRRQGRASEKNDRIRKQDELCNSISLKTYFQTRIKF